LPLPQYRLDALDIPMNGERIPARIMIAGKLVSHYRVIEKIGQGGLGVVYLAEDTILNRRVALKFLTRPVETSAGRKRILDEARVAASIDHPYVCKIFETGESDGNPYIVMEFLEGKTLAERMKSGPLQLEEALKMATEVCEALAEAHDKQIVHCDLKPANVMIMNNGHVKLMDFGLAKSAHRNVLQDDDETPSESVLPAAGTPAYMAPEQARGEKVDSRSDVFSFGILLFEMLTRTNPFRRNTAHLTVEAILHEDPPFEKFASTIPTSIARILYRALEKKPDERYSAAHEIWTDLIRARNNESFQVRSKALPAIAILPFTDFSPERNQEYFCDGLAEELISALGGLGQLHVASRTAAFRFKNQDVDLREIGRALNVTSILEGSVRKSGNHIRIVVKLVDVNTGYPLWSEKYDRQLDDIFEIQDDISRAIVEKLNITFTLSDSSTRVRVGPQNLHAYEFYLKGRYFWNKRTEKGVRLSIGYFERALAEDGDYALAHAGLADAYVVLCLNGAVQPGDVMPRAKEAAERALALSPEMPEALTSRACIRGIFDWDWQLAEKEFDAAIRVRPRYAQARQWYAINCLAPLGQFQRAKAELRRAAELEPVSLAIATSLGVLEFFERDYDSAIAQFKTVLEMDEGFSAAHYFIGQACLAKGLHAEAIRELERAVLLTERSSETLAVLGYAQASAGLLPEARHALSELSRRATQQYVSPVLLSQIQIGLQEYDGAISNLEEAFRLRSADIIWLNVRPAFDAVRSDPRFVGLSRRLGLAAARANGQS